MKTHKFHSESSKINFFKMLIELCNLKNESSLLDCMRSVEEELNRKYLTEINLSEFLRYCIVLAENLELDELKRLLAGKINKSVSDFGKEANVININSFKKAI
jgi:hypothetical protein